MSRSTSTSAKWRERQQFAAPISKADLTAIKKQFAVAGRVLPIPWAAHYAVSDCGRLFSSRATLSDSDRIREITPTVDSDGYLKVRLYATDGKRKNSRLHKLVAEAFVANTSGGRLVLHNDGNPANNNARNLRWGTHKENSDDSRKHGTLPLGSKVSRAKVHEIDIVLLRLLKLRGWPIAEAGAAMGYSLDYTGKVARGDNWQTLPTCDELLAKVLAALDLELQPERAVPKSQPQKSKSTANATPALAA